MSQQPISSIRDLRSEVRFLCNPLNFQQIPRVEVEAFVGLVDIDARRGILYKEVSHAEIDVGKHGSQVDRVAAIGLIGGQFSDLLSSGQGR